MLKDMDIMEDLSDIRKVCFNSQLDVCVRVCNHLALAGSCCKVAIPSKCSRVAM